MAVNIDFSIVENSTKTDAPRSQPQSGRTRLDDTFIDVTAEGEVIPDASGKSNARPLVSRRDQLSILSALLLLSAAFLSGQFLSTSSANQPERLTAYQVDLNSAGLEELVLLEGIGEVTAEKILLDRKANGPFLSKDQLQRVKGIGPKTMERLRNHIVCR